MWVILSNPQFITLLLLTGRRLITSWDIHAFSRLSSSFVVPRFYGSLRGTVSSTKRQRTTPRPFKSHTSLYTYGIMDRPVGGTLKKIGGVKTGYRSPQLSDHKFTRISLRDHRKVYVVTNHVCYGSLFPTPK